jgi:type 1 fimbria pilin
MRIPYGFLRQASATGALIAGALLYSASASALVTCTVPRVNGVDVATPPDYVELNVPILSSSVTVSALRDLPFGSELFSQRITNIGAMSTSYSNCTSNSGTKENFYVVTKIEFENGTPPVVGQLNGYDIYETGTPGIGYSLVWRDNVTIRSLPQEKSVVSASEEPYANSINVGSGYFYLALVKTGDIPAGTWNLPIDIPAIITYAQPGENMEADFNVKGQRIRISGSLNVVAGSCQTPDVYVQLGEYEITEEIEQVNWSSPWKEFNIQLINCPVMAGRYEDFLSFTNATNSWAGEGNRNTFVGDPWYPTVIAYRLDPVNELGATYGGLTCLKTDAAANGAEGVCIEIHDMSLPNANLGSGSFSNALAASNHDWRGKAFLNQDYLGSSATSYTIPLRARYSRLRQTSSSGTVVPLKAGPANASVEFTIFYE